MGVTVRPMSSGWCRAPFSGGAAGPLGLGMPRLSTERGAGNEGAQVGESVKGQWRLRRVGKRYRLRCRAVMARCPAPVRRGRPAREHSRSRTRLLPIVPVHIQHPESTTGNIKTPAGLRRLSDSTECFRISGSVALAGCARLTRRRKGAIQMEQVSSVKTPHRR